MKNLCLNKKSNNYKQKMKDWKIIIRKINLLLLNQNEIEVNKNQQKNHSPLLKNYKLRFLILMN